MNFQLVSLVAVAVAAVGVTAAPPPGIQRLEITAAPAVVTKVCGNGHRVDSVSLRTDGVKVTTGACVSSSGAAEARSDPELLSRAVHTPLPDGRAPGDECDTTCHTVCFKGTRSPVQADCKVIFTAIAGSNANFTLEQDHFVLYTYQGCGTSFTNQIAGAPQPQTLSQCFRDWRDIGSYIARSCVAADGHAGGKCVANYGSFVAVPDWYMQVYNT